MSDVATRSSPISCCCLAELLFAEREAQRSSMWRDAAEEFEMSHERNTAPARAAQLRNAAVRAVDDPVTLARAARIVRAALERGALTATDLQGEVVKPSDLGFSDA
jgi:hypothetical protein